jgi:YVTN family beta-propeller protein
MNPLRLSAALLPLGLFVPVARAQNAFVNWETPHVHPLTMTPNGQLLLAVNLPDDRLEVFSLASGSPVHVGSVPVGLDPVSVRARSDTQAWVVNHVSDTVSIVDLTVGQVIATLATDDEPCDVVFAGNPLRAFVSCSQANSVLVYDPANRGVPPARITIDGEDPRELALSPAGDKIYVAVFESGNRTTILPIGGITSPDYPPNVSGSPYGPYGGVTPPPNDGANFNPPMAPGIGTPPPLSLVARQNAAGRWFDDNGGDWTALVSGPLALAMGRHAGWTLGDHDIAVIDTSTLSVSYLDHLMNLCMGLAVNPASGAVGVIGTDAINEIRFEPNISGRFLRVLLALVDPLAPTTPDVVDLNPHLDYSSPSVPISERDKSISDPRGIAWNAAGTRAYVTGMGTNNVVVIDGSGARAGLAPTIAVGEGPTGIVLDEPRQQLYVLNKFAASISIVSTASELETARVAFFDPTPAAIREGRKYLYNAREFSGLGMTACAACHVDARIDRLAWDLGNPAGQPKNTDGLNHGGGLPARESLPDLTVGFINFHPMKGPMLTQTLQDIIGHEPHHWRGDRLGFEEFNPAFISLQGADSEIGAADMQEFEDFLATIHFPPNPYRTLENELSTDLPLPGQFTVGRFGPAGQPLPNGNAANGKALFTGPLLCHHCHTQPTGLGTHKHWNGTEFEFIPPGPNDEAHITVIPPVFQRPQNFKIPSLRDLYDRTGCDNQAATSRAGFGMRHDGVVDSLSRFASRPFVTVNNDQEVADLVAFLLSMSGGIEGEGGDDDVNHPPGPSSQSTPAAVGKQVTFNGTPNPGGTTLLNALVALADQQAIGLIARGRIAGLPRGFYYRSGSFQSDRGTETFSQNALLATAGASTPLTFTAVPHGSERRKGADRDADGMLDRDELDRGFDPADRHSPRAGFPRRR